MATFAQNAYESSAGAGIVRPVQTGFPVELTSAWEAGGTGTGYAWKRLTPHRVDALPGLSSALSTALVDPTAIGLLQEEGTFAIALDGSTAYTAGMKGWLAVAAECTCYIFDPSPAGAGAGAPGIVTSTTEAGGVVTATQLTQYQTTDPPTGATPYQQFQVTSTGAQQFVYPTGSAGPGVAQYQVTYPGANQFQIQQGALDGTTGDIRQYVTDPGTGAVTGYTEQFVIDDSGTPVTGSIQYQVVAGAIVATGSNITFAGSLAGGGSGTYGTLAAAGTTQGDAAAVTALHTTVTGATGTNGVVLPAGTSPDKYVIWNNSGSFPVIVYPQSGGQLNALGANTGYSLPNARYLLVSRMSSTQWIYTEFTL